MQIPADKVVRAKMLILKMLNNRKNKTTLRDLQKLCGFLNFLCKCIIPGRTFLRRLYSFQGGIKKPHHHIQIKAEMKADLNMWLAFLEQQEAYSRDFFEFDSNITADEIDCYTDAAGNKGCGGYHMSQWFIYEWEDDFLEECQPSINYLELYAVTVAVILWIHHYKNKKVTLFCDNMSVVYMVNTGVSNCRNCMMLLRIIALHCVRLNVKLTLKHVRTELNVYADALSQLEYKKFRQLARRNCKYFDNQQVGIPEGLEIENLWISD